MKTEENNKECELNHHKITISSLSNKNCEKVSTTFFGMHTMIRYLNTVRDTSWEFHMLSHIGVFGSQSVYLQVEVIGIFDSHAVIACVVH